MRRLAKDRLLGKSNALSAARGPRAGRSSLAWPALLLVAGLLVLWFWSWERPATRPAGNPSRAAAPAESQVEPRPGAELVPAPLPPAAPTANGASELAPFTSMRTTPAGYAGKFGSLRGRVEVSGEEPFPHDWRLVLRPSRTLAAREFAVERRLEFADGRQEFEVPDLPLGGYDVQAEAAGFNGQVLAVLLQPGTEHPFISLRMVPAGVLEGRILDADKLPAEGIPVTLFSVPENAQFEAVSDANGFYRFPLLPDGAYELLVGRASAPLIPERHPVRFQAPALTFPDLELPVLGALHVRVVDSLERPLEGVLVRGSGTNGGVVEGHTDYDGRLDAKYLPAGHYRLRLEHPALGEAYARRVAVDVKVGEVTQAPVRLGP